MYGQSSHALPLASSTALTADYDLQSSNVSHDQSPYEQLPLCLHEHTSLHLSCLPYMNQSCPAGFETRTAVPIVTRQSRYFEGFQTHLSIPLFALLVHHSINAVGKQCWYVYLMRVQSRLCTGKVGSCHGFLECDSLWWSAVFIIFQSTLRTRSKVAIACNTGCMIYWWFMWHLDDNTKQ